MFERNTEKLRQKLVELDIDVALITDDDSVYYYTGYYDYLHMEFGRPTILVVPKDAETLLITPSIDLNSAKAHARVGRIEAWNDGAGEEWRQHLPTQLQDGKKVAIEPQLMPPLVRGYIDSMVEAKCLVDIEPLVARMRMVKSPYELKLARHAGEVANAMMLAGRNAIADGVPAPAS